MATPLPEPDQDKYDADERVKIICLGDSAVGKSKLMERFLMDGYRPQQLSTYALNLYQHSATVGGRSVLVDFWDTAGQERFQSMHPSYYHKAHACIMSVGAGTVPPGVPPQGHNGSNLEPVRLSHLSGLQVFDVQRKVTYKNLANWYKELRDYRPEIPCLVVANKIDADAKVTQKSFNFAKKQGLPLYFVSAADGTNVVKVFKEAIHKAISYKQNSRDFMDEVMRELENFELEQTEQDSEKEDEEEEEEEGAVP
ncbi:RAB, member of RAS oncogene family-like 2 isoform X1 [Denticeps clupeoides]|uniref:RAB, member of RAS oncogene family-like 2 isoform X1 n=1 Tax=Denticeps clupeoides TaxID=299321 RepID=UPI0010A30D95|nr:rab-like protein 2A isoform X1 [Denticeps clupeoides]XP_028813423.1 rab-like protein 2A isoform X1 [Denticeps clupeoides]